MVDRQELRPQAGAKATLLLSAEEHAAVLPWCVVIVLLEVGRGQLGAFFPLCHSSFLGEKLDVPA